MTAYRRLDLSAGGSLYDRASRCLLRSFTRAREELDRVRAEFPGLVVEEGGGLLVLRPFAAEHHIHYAFPDHDSFRRLFAPLLERALQSADRQSYPGGILLYYRDHPNRPFVEPVLFSCAFQPIEEWMEMTLAEAPAAEPPLPAGFVIRACTEADIPQIKEGNDEAFGPGRGSPG